LLRLGLRLQKTLAFVIVKDHVPRPGAGAHVALKRPAQLPLL
jgi:hypothetical protein